ncbi:MAG: UDP-N-acetylmuramate dehydrogenase [Candidatus Edwardsbacteria bacterium]|nr:UDP-N-acetylmuramate dehydrogenase [Candidatus Edwardsbacteria bacterium]MBU1576503.1 UDP-N-acetylmuramate dehydrogenase [Candidatus Edwardsbacteria bacterium]MBU2594407.1 UDP-N-acetylmuramate dehydrogenase [Candidatus Edwardsbacteria bacterium]
MKIPSNILKQLAAKAKGQCRFSEPMSRHTSFRIGGPADLLVIPADEADLQNLLAGIHKSRIPYMVLGNGTNLLVLDGGIRGVVIKMTAGFRQADRKENTLKVGAGYALPRLVEGSAEMSLAGLEWGVGIPGSVGGALLMNAGAYGGQMSDIVKKVWGYTQSGDRLTLRAAQINFGYRHSEYPEGFVIAGTELEMQQGRRNRIKSAMEQWMSKRQRNQPLSLPSAGCIFKNPTNDSARRLIGVAGLKGKKIGGAKVSSKHANFIINNGGARAADVLKLIGIIKERTYKTIGIELVPEVKTVGEP